MINVVEGKCDFCGTCVGICPVDCIELRESVIRIDQKLCIDCELCVYICPIEVLKHVAE